MLWISNPLAGDGSPTWKAERLQDGKAEPNAESNAAENDSPKKTMRRKTIAENTRLKQCREAKAEIRLHGLRKKYCERAPVGSLVFGEARRFLNETVRDPERLPRQGLGIALS